MSYICEICDKKTVIGRSQRHRRGVAGKRWKKSVPATRRVFRPNLQKVTLKVNEKTSKMMICTKCLKSIKKFGKVKKYSNIAVA